MLNNTGPNSSLKGVLHSWRLCESFDRQNYMFNCGLCQLLLGVFNQSIIIEARSDRLKALNNPLKSSHGPLL